MVSLFASKLQLPFQLIILKSIKLIIESVDDGLFGFHCGFNSWYFISNQCNFICQFWDKCLFVHKLML